MVRVNLNYFPELPIMMMNDQIEPNKGQFHYRFGTQSHQWRPPTDVYETDEAVVVRLEVAGMQESDFSITISDKTLSIIGSRKDLDERLTFHQMEVRFGEFSSEIELRWPIDSQSVEAEYKDGFLRLVLPKTKPYQVKINK